MGDALDGARPPFQRERKMDLLDLLIFKTVVEEGGILRAEREP